ncbi:MAG TPA: hypothetical protein VFI16_05955 [Anaeromyxobacteraceae bacterium]|nr:hypothetical protein [Anaeromyxobacteraceae bacterium]
MVRKLWEKIEILMAAAAFAEEGEAETARQVLEEAGVAEPRDPAGKPVKPPSGLYPPRAPRASRA